MLNTQEILPAILGLVLGLICILSKFDLISFTKINDTYKIILPSIAIIILPFIVTNIFSWRISLIKEFTPLATILLVSIGFLNYVWNRNITTDKEITSQSILALERAYEILTTNQKGKVPLADRISWLTTARMLARYEKMKSELKTNLYKTICKEQEEYWRHKFYLLIKEENLYSSFYFENHKGKPVIEPKSALIVFGFAGWKEGKLDPLDEINTQHYHDSLSRRYRSLINYLSKYPKSIE